MCICPDSRWVIRGNELINSRRSAPDPHWHTVNFLLTNACGMNARVPIEDILNYLRCQGINLSREIFQQTILGELKELGIVATLVYPGPQGGVFIPCSEKELGHVAAQVLERVLSEVEHLRGISYQTPKVSFRMKDPEYIKRLENALKQMLTPLKDIPFNLVIESLTGHKVIPFDFANGEDKKILELLRSAAIVAGKEINKEGIESKRANEVGNYIEAFVKKEMEMLKLSPGTPAGATGKKKASGYPDIIFSYNGKPYYLECKTYNLENISTTQRSFYFSPSEDFKVVYDTHHFILSYEMVVEARGGDKNVYKTKSYKILSLGSLSVDVKYEFNSDNRRLYSGKDGTIVLDEGPIP